MKYIVYLTVNTKTDKIYIGVHKTKNPEVFDGYIGCGCNIFRPSSYKMPKTPMQYAVNKYGKESFKRYTLGIYDTEEEAYSLESILVTGFFVNRKDTYNILEGGRPAPESAVQGRKVYKYDINGKFVKEYSSICQAARIENISESTLTSYIKKKTSYNNFIWSFTYCEEIDPSLFLTKNRKVYCYFQDGKFERVFNSIQDAAEYFNVYSSNISRAIYGEYLLHNHYFLTEKVEKYTPKERTKIKGLKIYLYNLDGTFYKEYKTPIECARDFGLKSSSEISSALRLGKLFKRKYQISLSKKDKLEDLTRLKNRKIEQLDLNGNLIKTYFSKEEAIMAHGSGVLKVLSGVQKTCHNYVFKYRS